MRAIEAVPRTCGSRLNSAGRFGLSEPPPPVPVGIAALGHEAVDHPVEDDAVVKAFAGQLADPRDMLRRKIGAEADDDVAAAVEGEDEILGHRCVSFEAFAPPLGRPRRAPPLISTGGAARPRKRAVPASAAGGRDERQRTRSRGRSRDRAAAENRLDADDRLRPEFVRAVMERVEAGDEEGARALVEPLHAGRRRRPARTGRFATSAGRWPRRWPACSTPTSSPR